MNFKDKIKLARKEARLTQTELANELKFTQRSVCDWEKGRTEPNLETLASIARITDKPISWFFEEISG